MKNKAVLKFFHNVLPLALGALTVASAEASIVQSQSGSFSGMSWTATSTIIGQTSTGTIASGGDPTYLPVMPRDSGTVAVIMKYADGYYICSGSLLNDRRSILTAAHCVSNGTDQRPISTSVYFYGGSTDIVVPFNASSTAVAVTDYFVHSQYTGRVIDQNDIAVLRLASDAPAFAQSYGIYTGNDLTGLDYTVAGYGGRSNVGGSVGVNLGTGRLRTGDNRYDFRLGDADFGGDWSIVGPAKPHQPA